MATVFLSFTAQPEHVRTARLVAVAVARRRGISAAALESIRLAVGEACVRAVARSVAARLRRPVEIEIEDDRAHFVVRVRDHAPPTDPDDTEQLSLTLVQGLAHEVSLEEPDTPHAAGQDEGALRLEWRF